MIEHTTFKEWLHVNTSYSETTIKDIVSRMNRADKVLEWSPIETYIYYLEKTQDFFKMSTSVKSQLRKAVKLYSQYFESKHPNSQKTEDMEI